VSGSFAREPARSARRVARYWSRIGSRRRSRAPAHPRSTTKSGLAARGPLAPARYLSFPAPRETAHQFGQPRACRTAAADGVTGGYEIVVALVWPPVRRNGRPTRGESRNGDPRHPCCLTSDDNDWIVAGAARRQPDPESAECGSAPGSRPDPTRRLFWMQGATDRNVARSVRSPHPRSSGPSRFPVLTSVAARSEGRPHEDRPDRLSLAWALRGGRTRWARTRGAARSRCRPRRPIDRVQRDRWPQHVQHLGALAACRPARTPSRSRAAGGARLLEDPGSWKRSP